MMEVSIPALVTCSRFTPSFKGAYGVIAALTKLPKANTESTLLGTQPNMFAQPTLIRIADRPVDPLSFNTLHEICGESGGELYV